jgi:pyruvate kinase
MPVEEVPLVQKRVIREARRAAKPVITATQMLRSMVASPRPTRAEATDVANAILDGTDAVMLSEESAIGSYPVQAVETLDRIARRVEREYDTRALLLEPPSPLLRDPSATAISRSACLLARDLDARLIVATTVSGSTARVLARLRPPLPVVAITPEPAVRRQLALSWGVVPVATATFGDTDTLFERVCSACRDHGLAAPGDRVVITAGLPLATRGTTNLVRVIEV